MQAEMIIHIVTKIPEIVVPQSALGIEGRRFFVFVKTTDTTVKKHFVEVGKRTTRDAIITGGLKRESKIVSKGVYELKSLLSSAEMDE